MQVVEKSNEGLSRVIAVTIPVAELNEKLEARIKEVAPQMKLKGFRPGKVPTKVIEQRFGQQVRSEILDVLFKLEELEIVEEVEANKDGVICERDSQDVNRLDAKIPVDIVNGLHVFAGRIDLLL